MLFLEILDVNY